MKHVHLHFIKTAHPLLWSLLYLTPLALLHAEQVVFTEVMYHPKGQKPEYVECYNQTATPLDMAEWNLTGGIEFTFPPFEDANPAEGFLGPWERFVIGGASPSELREAYGIPESVRVFGPWSGRLSDAGDSIVLEDKNGVALVRLDYEDDGDWPAEADGLGPSLVLKSGDGWVNRPESWTFSQKNDGTPGFEPIAGAETPVDSPEVDLSQGILLVDFGDTWKFHDANQDLGTTWKNLTYADATWKSGKGLLGFESSALPEPGIQTPLNDEDQLTYYFRKSFEFNGDPAQASLSLDAILDDGAVFYLNGTEIARVGMGAGTIGFDTTSSRTVTNAALEENVATPSGSLLRKGVNILAAEGHQTGRSSSDIVFGARLRLKMQTASSVVINEVLPISGEAGFVEFYNPLNEAIELRNHYLSDTSGQLDKYLIKEGLMVPAKEKAVLQFQTIGLEPRADLSLTLTAPDGRTPLTAIQATLPQDGRSTGRKPDGGSQWYAFTDPTPGTPNGSDGTEANLHLNEVHYSEEGRIDWLEWINLGDDVQDLSQWRLIVDDRFEKATPLEGLVSPGQRVQTTIDLKVGNGDHTLSLATAGEVIRRSYPMDSLGNGWSWQAYPEGSQEFYAVETPSPGALNQPLLRDSIVIHEIMFDPPSNLVSGEFIELYNRGDSVVDLTGWRLTRGVDFVIPATTQLAPGGYLVIAADAQGLMAAHDISGVLGNYNGQLSNNGELIRLEDAWGNLVDEVDYKVGGEWPESPNGGGSSLELTHPLADNGFGTAWQASDESEKSSWQSFTFKDRFRQSRTFGGTTDYKEIYFHLVNDGHVVLRNIEFVKAGSSANLIENPERMSGNNRSANGWLAQGNHWQTDVDTNGWLHIISDGRGDNRPNRVEVDVPGMNRNDVCEIRFEAKWVTGSPRLIFSTWDHSIAHNFLIPIPNNPGTPGKANGTRQDRPPAQLASLNHQPAVPTSSDWVTIGVDMQSAEDLQYVRVYHRADNSNNTGSWQFETMFDNGSSGGDEQADDGRYTARLGAHRNNGRIVQFYVEARTTSGETVQLPRWGSEKPALYVVDDRQHRGDLRKMRVVVSAYDLGAISSGETSKYDYDFPRLANHYFNATFISNEKDIFYNAGIRHSGSPWTRGNNLNRGKLKLQKDKPFRGKVKHRWDDDASNSGRRHHNRITRYMLYLLGHPVNENEFVHVIINNQSPQLREDTEPVGNEFLDRNFENGADGELYRIDDEWWFRDTWDRQHRDASWQFKNTYNPGAYRTEWMKRTRETEDDFSSLIQLFETASRSYTQEEMEQLTDPHAIMKMFVVRGYIDDWDSISLRRGKNGYMYRRAEDGKFQFLHWDSDLTFGNSGAAFYQGLPRVNTYISKQYNKRLFFYYLTELLEKYTHNSARMSQWLDLEQQASRHVSINRNSYLNWFRSRERPAQNIMRRESAIPLEITTQEGVSFTTTEDVIELSGNASPGVFAIEVEGHPEVTFEREGRNGWKVRGIQLKEGDNALTLHGVDQWGQIRETVQTSVQRAGSSKPRLVMEARPASWNVSVEQSLRLDAGKSFDPEGDALRFTWEAPQAGATLQDLSTSENNVQFTLPGWYDLTVSTVDSAGNQVTQTRQASVYGRHGFSGFGDLNLDPWWTLQGGRMADNQPEGITFSTEEEPGHLAIQIASSSVHPWQRRKAGFGYLSRNLPAGKDWSFQTKLRLDTHQGDMCWTGAMVALRENGAEVWYGMGLEGADRMVIRRMTGPGTITTLKSFAVGQTPVEMRIRRSGPTLHFESGADGQWFSFHQAEVGTNATGLEGGLFMTTSEPVPSRVLVDYAMLVDPSQTSDLVLSLRPTEIMYHPLEPSEVEYVELTNTGATTIDLAGGQFIEGINYVFAPNRFWMLGPGERIVVTNDRDAFLAFYGSQGIRLANGSYDGKLDNAGERLTFVDSEDNVIFSVDYKDGGRWPERADGQGSSLEAVSLQGDPSQPEHWMASRTIHGSPGSSDDARPATVLINEILSHTDPPFEDAIELYNPGTQPIDIGGWYLSDAMNNLKKYRIPMGTQIAPMGFHVAYEHQFLVQNTLAPFALSSAFGDQVYLTQADANGTLVAFADTVEFPASENGRTMGRYPDGSERWTPLDHQTLGTNLRNTDPQELISVFTNGKGAPNAAPYVGSVVFSRIMYHPTLGRDEYIEIRNRSSQVVPLYDPLYPDNTWKLVGGVAFTFPNRLVMPPQSVLLIVETDPEAFRAKYEVPSSLKILGPYTGKLENTGETIRLVRPDEPLKFPDPDAGFVAYLPEDEVTYDNELPWPRDADGFGYGLQRMALAQDGSLPSNWTRFSDLIPSTEDRDMDGMPDDWEESLGLNPDNSDDAWEDADGDGMVNLHEYFAATDPGDAADRLSIESIQSSGGGQSVILTFPTRPGLTYAAEHATSMQAPDWVEVDRITAANQNPSYPWTLPAQGQPHGYYRIRLITQ